MLEQPADPQRVEAAFPDRDPVAVHREVWGVTLVCPGGGKYVWNAKYGTMESTVYGHPGRRRPARRLRPCCSSFTAAISA